AQVLPLYTRASTEGPFIQDARYIEQYYQFPEQKKALDVWGANNDFAHKIPQISLTPDETKEYNGIMNEITTYCDEMVAKFIIGDEPMDKYDEFVSNIKAMKIDRAIAIKEAAIKRFNSR
ncbi:MAG: ABC transporter substrate-binding protein, partial [Clostridia bacterium]|nr:ABC transporter substrate-binding protein [Clostridia bacterium]